MKLRIKENTIRLRLNQEDLAQFVASGCVEAVTSFDVGASLRYALQVSSEAERLIARMEDSRIAVYVPDKLAEEWTQTDRIGLEAKQLVEGERMLHVLVEKDLGCQHRSPTGEKSMFDHLRSEKPGSAE